MSAKMALRAVFGAIVLSCVAVPNFAAAQEKVVGVSDAEALFTDSDHALHANKQVVYHIIRDLLQAGHWELADQYLTDRYIQHNPGVASGRSALVDTATKIWKIQPKPIPERIGSQIVAVVAEGDIVVVAFARELKTKSDPSKTYTTTWFDMWRIKDGKADEHWDNATLD